MTQINRRSLLLVTAGTLAAPAILAGGRATAAARTITLATAWAAPDAATLSAFHDRSGVQVTVIRAPDAVASGRLAATGAADLAILPHDAVHAPGAALRPFAAEGLPIDALAPGMLRLAADWGVDMCWAPAGWSADGIAWRKDRWSPWSAAPSYADLWDGARTAFGPARGMLLGAGLHLEHTGALAPGSLWAAHGDDAAAADVWSKIESWCAPRTARIRASARGGADALARGAADAALIDARAAAQAARRGAPLSFAAPQEGAMARVLGLTRPAAASAATLAPALSFIAFVIERDGGMADWSGGEALMDPEALMSLHPLLPETAAHAARRSAVAARVFG
jgi:spermidine/putrescine transport system substrate-binding protein